MSSGARPVVVKVRQVQNWAAFEDILHGEQSLRKSKLLISYHALPFTGFSWPGMLRLETTVEFSMPKHWNLLHQKCYMYYTLNLWNWSKGASWANVQQFFVVVQLSSTQWNAHFCPTLCMAHFDLKQHHCNKIKTATSTLFPRHNLSL